SLAMDGLLVAVETVATREDFAAALKRGDFDLILSDFALPGFDGASALGIARDTAPGVPFIMVSGQLGEEAAVESVRGGATDYVLKQRRSRLGPSVRRDLVQHDSRRRRPYARR